MNTAWRPDDAWHFPRPSFAKSLVKQLEIGLATRLILVAPRRKGKTEFLLHDLAPEANRAGYTVVYASLWANVNAPHVAILDALNAAVETGRRRESITRKLLETAINRVRIDALGIGAELEFADHPAAPVAQDTTAIDSLIDALSQGRRTKLLLMLDEIQHLGTERAFLPLVYSMRTTLDRLRAVRVVFCGSSRGAVRKMFGEHDAPFYGFATEVELPDLGPDFTNFLSEVFRRLTQRHIDSEMLWKHFEALDRNPFYARQALKSMALDPALPMRDAFDQVLAAVAEQNDYDGIWGRLTLLERLLFLKVARNPGSAGLHSQESITRLSEATGSPVTRGMVARHLRRLVANHLISATGRGHYQVEMSGFAHWARQQRPES